MARSSGQLWENGYIESFNARLRDELLDGEIFYTLREAQIVIERWRTPLQRGSPACLAWLSGPGTGGVCASLRRVAGGATRPAPPATLPLAPRPSLN